MAVDPTPVLWERILDEVQLRLPSPQAFDTWFQPLRPRLISDAALEVEVPSLFFAEWIQQHYFDHLAEAATAVLATSPAIRFIVSPDLAIVPPRPEPPAIALPEANAGIRPVTRASAGGLGLSGASSFAETAPQDGSGLIPRYTFATFVVGASNHMSHAASAAVGEQPGQVYNPLVIYGGVGLGKTHLMHAIGHRIRQERPGAVIYYMSAEKFMNQMIAAIQTGSTLAFREKYRRADLLLIDDV
ncbi:MAG: DnaA/Hda family protein, partial [Candidatus Eisenbacteria bacterium]